MFGKAGQELLLNSYMIEQS